MFQYIPKKSNEIYSKIIAHRGLHCIFPENTIPAYIEAINRKYAIELDVRITKDKELICIHDRYAKRLLGKKGKISNYNYNDIKDLKILNSMEKVPKLIDVLKIVNGNVPLLIEIKGLFTNEYKSKLLSVLSNYNGKVYFHAKNIITFVKLKNIYDDKVFWILNPLRKRFNFIKSKSYKQIISNEKFIQNK